VVIAAEGLRRGKADKKAKLFSGPVLALFQKTCTFASQFG
jgi:hypothetical protein